jgi:GNAT superfamily N-acetyltransferase
LERARLAETDDQAACARLLDEGRDGARTMRGGPALLGPETTQTLLERWNGPRTGLFVGEYEGAVVGLLAVSLSEPAAAAAGSVRGLIECCYVEPDARGVGVGSSLMEAAVAWGQDQGCTDLDALALPGDRQTKQRFEAAGFTARLLTLSRRLD